MKAYPRVETVSKRSINISGIFSEDNELIIIKNFHFTGPLIIFTYGDGNADKMIGFENCVFNSIVELRGFDRTSFLNNEWANNISIASKWISLNGNRISKAEPIAHDDDPYFLDINREFIFDSVYRNGSYWGRPAPIVNRLVQLEFEEKVLIENNHLDTLNTLLKLSGETSELTITNNRFNGILNISNVIISDRVDISGNSLTGYLDISRTVFPEVFRRIILSRNSNFQLCVVTEYPLYLPDDVRESLKGTYYPKMVSGDSTFILVETPYLGDTEEEVGNELIYDLKRSYLRVHEIAKENTDLNTANWAYVSMMDLEGKRLKDQYSKDKNFTNYFRWQLNALLKAYTNHGTDPAKSVVISIYVLLIFSVFYFFFPSDWDVSSKSKLLSDFKAFTKKNEKGYFKTFLKLITGFTISLINAITLSVNSFTTLGFGNIPTHGIAKYFCIIQGFIGWFLLSLFTVALINQLLL
jgi:hypothetical protein